MSCKSLPQFTIDRFLPPKENVNLVEITDVQFTNNESTELVGFKLQDGKFAKLKHADFGNITKAKIYDTNYTKEHTGELVVSSLTCKIIEDYFLRKHGAWQAHEKQKMLRECVNGKFINTKDSGFEIVSSGGRRRSSSRKYKRTANRTKSRITRRQRK